MSRNSKILEQEYNIPSVGSAAANIIEYALTNVYQYNTGTPIRYIAFPFPVTGQPQSVHHQFVFEGRDIVTGKPLMQAFIDALTAPLNEEEMYKGAAPEPDMKAHRFLGPDTEDNLHRLFKENDWTDYLPIVLPTEKRVAEMLMGTSREPHEIIKVLDWPGGRREVTVERVAICAVMAGAKPEHLPVILALANHVPFGHSTSSMANMIVVNGPIRDEIGMNYGLNAMGPHNEANSVIGRSYTIMSKTIGGLHSGVTTFSALGSTMQYNNVTIAENEEALPPGWEPFHVQAGYNRYDSVISVATGWSYISSVTSARTDYPAHIKMGDYMKALYMGSSTVIMDPSVAKLLYDLYGFETKEQLIKWFAENVEKVDYASGETRRPFREASVNLVVTGGGNQTTWFVTDFGLIRSSVVSGGSTLIDEWR